MSISVDPTDVVRLSWDADLRITGELAAEAMAMVDVLNGDRERALLVDMQRTAVLTREARQRFSHRCSASRIALLGSSAVDRVIANFALGVSATPVPTRFFTSEPVALAWLRDGPDDRADDRTDDRTDP